MQVFDTLNRLPDIHGSDFFDDAFMDALAAQLIYSVFEGDANGPQNYMDGGNGWCCVNLGAGSGYAPFGLTRAGSAPVLADVRHILMAISCFDQPRLTGVQSGTVWRFSGLSRGSVDRGQRQAGEENTGLIRVRVDQEQGCQ